MLSNQTHRIFTFHPTLASLQELEVVAPWQNSSIMYPAPHPDLLRNHFTTAIAHSLRAVAGYFQHEDNDDDDDEYDVLEEMEDSRDNNVSVWRSDELQSWASGDIHPLSGGN